MTIDEPTVAVTGVPQELQDIFERQRNSFRQCAPLGLPKRLEALDVLLQSIFNHQDAIVEAETIDFGQRSAREIRLLEIFPLVDEIRFVKRNLRRWMRPKGALANWQFLPGRTKIVYQPLGVVGIIGAWNYPVLLTLSPLVKRSRQAIMCSLNHLSTHRQPLKSCARSSRKHFPKNMSLLSRGGPEVASVFSALPFDHILFTGSERVGKLVMKAAAENLTPVTLELGGKSPALVHESYPMAIAADRVCSAKFWNAGQTCIAPDYVLVPLNKAEEFVGKCKTVLSKRYPNAASNVDYTHLISQAAWERMRDLAEDARNKGARVLQVDSNSDVPAQDRFFPPTFILDANNSIRVMQEEIFGPILPVVTYSSLENALCFINDRPRPLALYYFDRNKSRIEKVLEQTVSGGAAINDCIFHFVQHQLPFGGVGSSGMGAYHGFDGFCAFSKKKGVLIQNSFVGSFLDRALKPPYTSWSDRTIAFLVGQSKARPVQKMTLSGK